MSEPEGPNGGYEWEEDFRHEYITRALDLLMTACNTEVPGLMDRRKRLQASRESMMYSAFAAEAQINAFLMRGLPTRDFDAVDRLPTIEKYVVASRVAANGRKLFDRGSEPVQSLQRLFKARDGFVHPKPRTISVLGDALWDEPLHEQVNPRRAEEALSAVCEAAMILRRETFDHEASSIEAAIVHHRAKFKEIAERAAAYPPPTQAQANAELARALGDAMDRGWLSEEQVFVDAERRAQAGRLIDIDAVAQLIADAKLVPLAEVRRRLGLDAG